MKEFDCSEQQNEFSQSNLYVSRKNSQFPTHKVSFLNHRYTLLFSLTYRCSFNLTIYSYNIVKFGVCGIGLFGALEYHSIVET